MAHLSLRVLGSLLILVGDEPATVLESDKARALLIYLAVEADSPHRRESLVGLLWPEYPEQAARHSLRQALFNLRQAIGDHASRPPYLLISRDTIQFNRASDFSLDLAQFNTIFEACEGKWSRDIEDPSIRAAQLEELIKLYRGEFLQDFFLEDSAEFQEWSLVQRESLYQHVLKACRELADYYELHGDLPAARRHTLRQLELDPWREEAHCQMIRVLALDGQRSAALAQYETCRRVLAEQLDVEPSTNTRELVEEIRAGTLKTKEENLCTPIVPIHNLPASLTSFLGREQELSDLDRLITNPECRCLSLVGPGGIGKTRLALQTAEQHRVDFADGVAFIPLAPVDSVGATVPAIARTIELYFYGPDDPKVQLLNYLSEKQMLLILDNVEQFLTEESSQAHIVELMLEILKRASEVKLLVTSRELLNLQEEWVFEVQGLPFPDPEQTESLGEYAAVALFIQRAKHASPGFAFNEADLIEIAHICRLVEGMPLAIELAATWLRTLSPAEIAQEIEGSLDVLSASLRDLPERHRSMRVVFDRSWQRLSDKEQQVLSQLSVFRGGFSRQAAEQVAGASLPALSSLVNRTLLRRAAAGRYQPHLLVRQYCAMHLAADLQAHAVAQRRHYDYFLALAEGADQGLRSHDQLEWLRQLEQEQDNLRAALEWALEYDRATQSEDELALRLSGALRVFWRMHGHFLEGRDWLAKCLIHSPESNTAASAAALAAKASLLYASGDVSVAQLSAEESAAIYRELGDECSLARVLVFIGSTLVWQGEASLAQARLEEALTLCHTAGDRWVEAYALYVLGNLLADRDGDPTGRAMLEESAVILEDVGDKGLLASELISLGILDVRSGEYGLARASFERGLALAEEVGYPLGTAEALSNLGRLHRILGDYAVAQTLLEEALHVYQEHGSSTWESDVLCALAENALSQGDLATARLRLQAAGNRLGTSGNQRLQTLERYLQGVLAYHEGDTDAAVRLLEETMVLAREGQFSSVLAQALVTLGRVKRIMGQVLQASDLVIEGMELSRALDQKLGIATALEELGAVSAVEGDGIRAAMLFSKAHALREVIGAPLPPVDRPAYDSVVSVCRAQLDPKKTGQMKVSHLGRQGSLAKPPKESTHQG
jgi:predicted ATPase/DNA-binding SARP family transcriptional activator